MIPIPTVYVNPVHGNDATALIGSRARPFKTHQAAHAALDALPPPELPEGVSLAEGQTQPSHVNGNVVTTYQVPPAEDPPTP